MPVVSSPLLREWDMLQRHVVPPLVEVGRRCRAPRTWSVDSVADAVAVVAAYQYALRDPDGPGTPAADGDEGQELEAFSSGYTPDLSPLSFSLADVRAIPAAERTAAFRRQARRWVPGEEIAQQVVLGPPGLPVDLVTLRGGPDLGAQLAEAAVESVDAGGRLLLVEPTPRLSGHPDLEPLESSHRMFVKRARRRARTPSLRTAIGGADHEACTLARHQAQADLVGSHLGLARSLARRFSHHGESRDDLEQVALLALVKAARRFDPSRETSFSTYATASILGEIKRHFRDKTWMMRVPRSVQELYLAIKDARESLTHELAASPTIQQIAARIGISDEAVLEAMEAGENYWPESLDVAVFEGEAAREVPVQEAGFDLSLERTHLARLLPRLAPRERLILKRLFLDDWTQRQVADEVGVSQMQVSRLQAKALRNLQVWGRE